MRSRLLLCLCLCLLLASVLSAQDLGILEEPSAFNQLGIGARQMSMGGAGIANSLDGAALYYNPAALARIPRIEFQIEMSHQKFTNETTMPPNRYDPAAFQSTINSSKTDASKNRLSSLNLAVPIPTFRGALVVAFGVHRVMNFDRASLFHIADRRISDGALVDDSAIESESGNIYMYSGGAGIDLSPNFSVGASLNFLSGKDNMTFEWHWIDETNDPERHGYAVDTLNDYFGVSVKMGALYRPSSHLTVGLAFESPTYWEIEQTFIDGDYRDVTKYNLLHPLKMGAGMSYRRRTLTLTGEAEYVRWSKMKYSGNADMETYNDSMSQLYRDVINLRMGAEYEFPRAGLSARAGIFSQPLPYSDEFIVDDRMGFSFGFGWLIDKALLLEGAYVHGGMKRTYTAVNAEYTVDDNKIAEAEDRFGRLYVTLSYRY